LIIISIISDQPRWGKIIESKLAGVCIPFRKLTKQKLLSTIADTESLSLRRQAVRLGEQINAEDGLKKTINAMGISFGQYLGK
jgi:UDP:flavonoid glycosyltransferase YjiC (YdhE family)